MTKPLHARFNDLLNRKPEFTEALFDQCANNIFFDAFMTVDDLENDNKILAAKVRHLEEREAQFMERLQRLEDVIGKQAPRELKACRCEVKK